MLKQKTSPGRAQPKTEFVNPFCLVLTPVRPETSFPDTQQRREAVGKVAPHFDHSVVAGVDEVGRHTADVAQKIRHLARPEVPADVQFLVLADLASAGKMRVASDADQLDCL